MRHAKQQLCVQNSSQEKVPAISIHCNTISTNNCHAVPHNVTMQIKLQKKTDKKQDGQCKMCSQNSKQFEILPQYKKGYFRKFN